MVRDMIAVVTDSYLLWTSTCFLHFLISISFFFSYRFDCGAHFVAEHVCLRGRQLNVLDAVGGVTASFASGGVKYS